MKLSQNNDALKRELTDDFKKKFRDYELKKAEEINELVKCNNELKDQVKTLGDDLKTTKSKLSTAELNIQQKNAQYFQLEQDLKRTIAEKEEDKKVMQNKIDCISKELSKTKQELVETKQELKETNKLLKETQESLLVCQQHIIVQKKESQQLFRQLDAKNATISKKDKMMDKMFKKIMQLSNKDKNETYMTNGSPASSDNGTSEEESD